MMKKTLMRLVVVASLLAVLVLPWKASPAYACSCASNDTGWHVDRADVVLVGRIQQLEVPGPIARMVSSAEPVRAFVQVERYLKGTGGKVQVFRTPLHGPSCGFLDTGDVGRRYVLFLRGTASEYSTNLCSGNVALDQPSGQTRLAQVEAITGPGVAPQPPPETGLGGDHAWRPWMPAIVGGATALALGVAAGALYLVRCRHRSSAQ